MLIIYNTIMIKAVLFDVDGVMIDSFEANLKFYQGILAKFGYKEPTRDDYLPMFHMPMLEVLAALTKSNDTEKLKAMWNAGKTREIPYPIELVKSQSKLPKVIGELSENFILGIVTSRIRGGVYEIPALGELEKYFATLVCYEDTKKHKPDPEPLLLAADRLNIPNVNCVYIGDSQSDMIAAKSAGMKALLYSSKNYKDADIRTSVFEEIPKLVKAL